jgi:L-cysteine:1D-myo-inositol 2-amino-2-deoxy-alpha-D-glucopyranoside ligase
MATAICGLAVDVHAGGADLAYPHHTYEQAIVEAATGVTPFARRWMHVGTVTRGGEKVAKSTGNLVFVVDLLQRWAPQTLRLHLLDRPWSRSWDFDEADLDASAARLEALWSAGSRPGGAEAAVTAALEALMDDLDVPRALDIAVDEGGEAARTVAKVLALL